jgi:formate hydrogenlyase subunit 3/multisubunit Na+/H+ antiporter MnhD subunit
MIVLEAFRQGHPGMAAVALAVSLLTLLSMLKIFMAAFWRPKGDAKILKSASWRGGSLVLGAVTLACLAIGAFAGHFAEISGKAADELFDRQAYSKAVFELRGLKGGSPP